MGPLECCHVAWGEQLNSKNMQSVNFCEKRSIHDVLGEKKCVKKDFELWLQRALCELRRSLKPQ